MKIARVLRAVSLLAALLSTGCATTAMKGTPFFTGDYARRQGPVEDRVNLWPLMYYRDPALSIAWPIVEHVQDEHFALRPLFSVYGLGTTNSREWNVLWPIFQQEEQGDGHIFPLVWWGDDYFNIFPLYWHGGGAGAKHDILFPIWWYTADKDTRQFYLALGLLGSVREPGARSWWAFPLAGDLRDADGSRYAYQLWPLLHQARNAHGDRRLNACLPLWWWSRDGNAEKFCSLLWSQGHTKDGTDWSLLFPFYWSFSGDAQKGFYTLLGGYRKEGDEASWLLPLLLSGGTTSPRGRDTWLLAGLGRWQHDRESQVNRLLPFYASSSNASGTQFFSIPWSSVQARDGSGWSLVPPLYFNRHDAETGLTLSPFYFAGHDDRARSDWHAVFPLYYSGSNNGTRTFATLLGGREDADDGRSWTIYPLLSKCGNRGGTNDWWVLAPLAHFKWDDVRSSSHVLPLYYRDSASGTFVSLPYAAFREGERRRDIVPPLLSWRTHDGTNADWWVLGGLGHFSSGPAARPSHLIPLYYHNPARGFVLSPLYAQWSDSDGVTRIIPPLLGGATKRPDGTDWFALLGLAGYSTSTTGAGSHYLFPLYAWKAESYFYNPVFGWKRDSFAYYATPLVGSWGDEKRGGSWFFPIYSASHSTLPDEHRSRFLWAFHTERTNYARTSFFPLFSHTYHGDLDLPLEEGWRKRRGSETSFLLLGWHENLRGTWQIDGHSTKGRTRAHGFFPLWNYRTKSDDEGRREDTFNLLWKLYDSKRQVVPLATAPGGTNDYARQSVLWRAWHYEKLNGDVSADMIPFITYDRRQDGFTKYSFLWRVFRWERDPTGKRKLDLLMIPVLRD